MTYSIGLFIIIIYSLKYCNKENITGIFGEKPNKALYNSITYNFQSQDNIYKVLKKRKND